MDLPRVPISSFLTAETDDIGTLGRSPEH